MVSKKIFVCVEREITLMPVVAMFANGLGQN
jgi:hypothetical protein